MSAPTDQEIVPGFAVWADRNGWSQDEDGVWFRIEHGAPVSSTVEQLQGDCLFEQCRILLAEAHLHRQAPGRLRWLLTHEQFALLANWAAARAALPSPFECDPATLLRTLFGLPITRGGDCFGLVVMPVESK